MTDDVERARRREELLYRRELAVRARHGLVPYARVRVVPRQRDGSTTQLTTAATEPVDRVGPDA